MYKENGECLGPIQCFQIHPDGRRVKLDPPPRWLVDFGKYYVDPKDLERVKARMRKKLDEFVKRELDDFDSKPSEFSLFRALGAATFVSIFFHFDLKTRMEIMQPIYERSQKLSELKEQGT